MERFLESKFTRGSLQKKTIIHVRIAYLFSAWSFNILSFVTSFVNSSISPSFFLRFSSVRILYIKSILFSVTDSEVTFTYITIHANILYTCILNKNKCSVTRSITFRSKMISFEHSVHKSQKRRRIILIFVKIKDGILIFQLGLLQKFSAKTY